MEESEKVKVYRRWNKVIFKLDNGCVLWVFNNVEIFDCNLRNNLFLDKFLLLSLLKSGKDIDFKCSLF